MAPLAALPFYLISFGSITILPTLPLQHCNLTLTHLAELLSNLVSFVEDCYLPMAPGQHCNFAVATRQHYNLPMASTANLPWLLWQHSTLVIAGTVNLPWLLCQHCYSTFGSSAWLCFSGDVPSIRCNLICHWFVQGAMARIATVV